MDNRQLGAWGEEQAAQYLVKNGYEIVGRNFRCRMGEVDIIARLDNVLAFVEVKLRRSGDYVRAGEYVTVSKQRRIIAAAVDWLSKNDGEYQPRFDVMELYARNGADSEDIRINHIEDAFR